MAVVVVVVVDAIVVTRDAMAEKARDETGPIETPAAGEAETQEDPRFICPRVGEFPTSTRPFIPIAAVSPVRPHDVGE